MKNEKGRRTRDEGLKKNNKYGTRMTLIFKRGFKRIRFIRNA